MKYHKFCCCKPQISTLIKKEIENPYLVLEEQFTKRTIQGFQNALCTLQRAIFKDNEWKNHDPADFYILCYDLIRLMDALYLINKYSPKLSSPLNDSTDESSDSELMDSLNKMFTYPGNKDPHQENDKTQTILANFFDNHYNGFNRHDIYSYLQLGLDVSFMRNSKYDYFNIQEYDLASNFYNLSELITEGHKIYQYGAHVLPNLQSCKEIKFAIDYDRPTRLSYECLAQPSDLAEDFFSYYLDINHINNGLKVWEKLLYKKDFWKKAGNPGNLFHLQECLVKLIETIWLMGQKGEMQSYQTNYKVINEATSIAKNCTLEEQTIPLLAIESFFAFKKMHKWKMLLHKWLTYSLSNAEKITPKNQHKTELAFRQLLKFIEATHLLMHGPKETDNAIN